MNFNVQIIQHAEPAVTVTISDPVSGGIQPVTYSQVRRSLGTQVYIVDTIYLYSENLNQLTGAINYNVFDASGNQNITNLITLVDPNQDVNSLFVDISKSNLPVIFNGNSSVSTTILPNTYVQVKFFARRLTNTFGNNLLAFKQMEEISGKSDFFENYGAPIEQIHESERQIINEFFEPEFAEEKETRPIFKNASGGLDNKSESTYKPDITPIVLLSVSALSLAGYFLFKKK
jgi:hypothetical protein